MITERELRQIAPQTLPDWAAVTDELAGLLKVI